ncbi:MAG: hypothetical protein DHS20C15_33330 [Planctomycetota bacterium]|nr:MAG: hypothetical protein DHS20C15_33330 [Planctomycetota bacterium]
MLLHLAGAIDVAGQGLVRSLQLAMGLGILASVFLLAARLAGVIAGVTAFVLLALYAPVSFQETKLLDTTLGLFTSMSALLLLERNLRTRTATGAHFAGGVCFGIAALARPVNLLIALAFAPVVMRQGKASACVFLVGVGAALAPITLYNFRGSGDVVLINYSEGHSLLVGNNPNAHGMYNLPPGYPDGVLNERAVEQQIAAQRLGRRASPNEQRGVSMSDALEYMMQHPGELPRLLGDKLRFATTAYEVDDNYSIHRERERLGLLRPHVVPFALLLALALPAFLLNTWRRRWLPALPLLTTLASLLVFYTNIRYRLPAAPLLAVAAGVTLSQIRHATRARQLAALVVAGACFSVSTWMPLPYPRAELERSSQQFDVILDLHAAGTLLPRGESRAAAGALSDAWRNGEARALVEAWIEAALADLSASERAAFLAEFRDAAETDPQLRAVLDGT